MKARGAGFESANSLAHTKDYSIGGGATVVSSTSSHGRGSGTPIGKTEWVKYSKSLEDSLTEAKEYATTLESKAEATQAALMAKIELAMEQNTKLLAIMAKGEFNAPTNNNAKNNQRSRKRVRKELRVCGEYGKES